MSTVQSNLMLFLRSQKTNPIKVRNLKCYVRILNYGCLYTLPIAQGQFKKTIDRKNIHIFYSYFHVTNDSNKHIMCYRNSLACHMVLMCYSYIVANALKRQIFVYLNAQI